MKKHKEKVHVIEKIPNTVTVSREIIAKAWKEQVMPIMECYKTDGYTFDAFCRALGLKEVTARRRKHTR